MTDGANLLTSRAIRQDPDGPRMNAAELRAVTSFYEKLGYDVPGLLRDIGVEPFGFDDSAAVLPRTVLLRLALRVQQVRPLKNHWAHLAAATPREAVPLIDYLALTSDTVGEALRQVARYLRLVNAGPRNYEIREEEDPIRVVFTGPEVPQIDEYSAVFNVRRLREETEDRVAFVSVSFTHEPDDVPELEQMLGCPVRSRASWAGLALSPEAWRVPLRRRDPLLHRILEAQASDVATPVPETESLALKLRRVLRVRLARGETEIEVIARQLGMSARTLQRHLSLAGQSYRDLLDATRREMAEKCILDRTLSVGEVAYLVGYSEPAAFHRAFKRWTGVAPQAFRQQHGASASLLPV